MKKYVFLQPSICGMGGAQQYLYRKIFFLEELGWKTTVISAEKGEIFIDELKKYSNTYIKGIKYSPCYYRKSDIKKMVDRSIEFIEPQKSDQIIIESSTASTALWGEKIAEKLECKHVCFDFEEIFTNLTKSQLDFMDFKHCRGELCGINDRSLPNMFRGYKDVPKEKAYFYNAMCSNPVADVECELTDKLKGYGCVIGTIGRAEKPYLIPTLKKIREYTHEHNDVNFAVLFIGGAKQKKYEQEAEKIFLKETNVDFYCTGMIFPVPKKLLHTVDVFVSSAGSAHATAREDIPTIAVSANTFGANGILNYTTKFAVVPDVEVNADIKELLYSVLDNKYCEKHEALNMYDKTPYDEIVKKQCKIQLDFVMESKESKDYYNVEKVKKEGKSAVIAFFARVLGRKLFLLALKLLEKSKLTFLKA